MTSLFWFFSILGMTSASTTTVFEDTFDDWDPSNYNTFYAPDSLTTKEIKSGGDEGIKFKLVPFVDNGLPGPAQHVRFAYFRKNPVEVDDGEVMKSSLKLSLKTYHTKPDDDDQPIWWQGVRSSNDPRLATGSLINLDPDTSVVGDFFITNTAIYAYYERLPFSLSDTNHYLTFGQSKKVGSRSSSDINTVSVAYDKDNNKLTWFIEDEAVASVTDLGVPTEEEGWVKVFEFNTGEPKVVYPASFNVGFGTFSLFDFADFTGKDKTGLIKPEANLDDVLYPTQWYGESYDPSLVVVYSLPEYGQGATFSLYDLKVTLKS